MLSYMWWLCVQILKERFGMVAPDVQIEDGKGTILISSEEGETEGKEGVTVKANPLLDINLTFSLTICHL